jgi:PAS domain-containing protein
LLALFHAFSLKSTQMQRAIKTGNDDLVGLLDRDMESIVAAILAYRARSTLEIYMQLQFLISMIRQEADDSACVARDANAMSALLDRYFSDAHGAATDAVLIASRPPEPELPLFAHSGGLSDVILESMTDHVAVVTRDYRYLYANTAHAAALSRKPIELVGKHIREVIGSQRFENRARANLDGCFAGNSLSYEYTLEDQGDHLIGCKMTPVRGAKGEVLGALVQVRVAVRSALTA